METYGQIVLTGFVGSAGAKYLLKDRREELLKRFSASFLRPAENSADVSEDALKEAISVLCGNGIKDEAPDATDRPPVLFMLGEGGLYTALWNMAASYRCGFRVRQSAVPIRQQTVEICNYFDVNPYGLYSEGCALLITGNASEALRVLREKGIPAAHIGILTKEKKKVLLRKDEERFLLRPQKDPLEVLTGKTILKLQQIEKESTMQ